MQDMTDTNATRDAQNGKRHPFEVVEAYIKGPASNRLWVMDRDDRDQRLDIGFEPTPMGRKQASDLQRAVNSTAPILDGVRVYHVDMVDHHVTLTTREWSG